MATGQHEKRRPNRSRLGSAFLATAVVASTLVVAGSVLPVAAAGELTITKTSSAAGGPVRPGDTITYTVVVTNTSNDVIDNLELSDALPGGVTYVDGSSVVTYGQQSTGTFTHDMGPASFDVGGLTQSYTVTDSDIPAGSTLTSYQFTATGSSVDWLSDISLQATYPGGTAYNLGAGSFGGNGPGAFNQSRGPGSFTGSALGTYRFTWRDGFDGVAGNDNTVTSARFTINYTFEESVSNPGGLPASLITAADDVDLAPGQTAVVTFDVVVDDPLPILGTELTNSATASAAGIDAITATATDTVENPPELSVSKSDSPDPAVIGEPLTYTIDVANDGGPATDVVVTETLPDNVSFVSATFTGGSGTCSESGGVVTCDLGSMATLDTATIEIEVIVDDVVGSQTVPLWTTPTEVNAAGTSAGPSYRSGDWTGNDAGTGPITVSAGASDLTNTATFTSTPTGAMGVVDGYADPYGLGSPVLAPSFEFTYVWDSAPEAGTAPATDDAGTMVLTFTFSEPVVDPVLHLDRLGGSGSINNVGEMNSTRLTLLDGLTLTELAGVGHFETNDTQIWRSLGIPATAAASLECTTDTFDGTACGTVQINGTVSEVRFLLEPMPGSIEGAGGDAFEVVWDVRPQSDLAVTKTASDIIHVAGDTYRYTVTAINNGPNTEYDAVVTETLPAGVTYVSASSSTGTFDGSTWSIGTMASGATETLTIDMSVPAAVAESMFENVVGIAGENSDPDLANNGAVAPVYTCPAETFPNIVEVTSGVDELDISDNGDQACTEVAATVTVAKVSNGGVDTFSISGTNLEQPIDPVTTLAAGVVEESDRHLVTDLNADVTLVESLPAGWNFDAVSCVDDNAAITGNSGVVASSTSPTVTVPNAALLPGAAIVCTFVNDRQARLTITKQAVGGGAGFDFTVSDGGGLVDSFGLNPNPPNSPTESYLIDDAPIDGPLDITELTGSTPNFALVSISCVDSATSASGSTFSTSLVNGGTVSGVATVDLVAGADVGCTFTNVKDPEIVVVKNTVGGDGTFDYAVTSSAAGTSVDDPAFALTTATGTATLNTAVDGLRPNGPTETDLTISEADPVAAGFELTDLSCTDLTTGDPVGTVDLVAGQATLSAVSAGDSISCTYGNVRRPTVTVVKESIGGTEAFDFTTSNLDAVPTPLTLDTTTTNPATSATYVVTTVSQDVVIDETLTGEWQLESAGCVDSGGTAVTTSLVGTALTIPTPSLASGRDLTCTFVNAAPVIDLIKTAGTVTEGSFDDGTYTVTYTVTAENSGTVEGSYSFTDTATAPAGMVVSSVTLSTSDADVTTSPTNGTTSASVANEPLAAGDSDVWLVTVVYDIVDPTAAVAGDASCDETTGSGGFANDIIGDDDSSNNQACVDVPAEPSLELTKAALAVDGVTSPLEYSAPGQIIEYRIEVANTGNSVIDTVSVVDPVADPGSLVLDSGDDGDGLLEPGETWVYRAVHTVTQADVDAGRVDNTASVSSLADTDGDGVGDTPLSDSDSDTVPAVSDPSLSLIKAAGALTDSNGDGVVGGVGDEISYTFTVTNTGNQTVTDVAVGDALVTVSGGPIASLAPGESDSTTFAAVYTITQVDVDAGEVVNSAVVSGSDPAGDPVTDVSDDPGDPTDVDPDGDGDPDDPTVVPLAQSPDVSVTKTAGALVDSNGDGVVGGVGDEISYSFEVSNTGDVTLTDVSVSDPLVTVSGGPVVSLAPGDSDSTTFTAVYTITQADVDAGEVVNSATVSGSDPAGDPVSDVSDDPGDPTDVDPDGDGDPDDPTVTPLAQSPDVSVTKTAGALDDSNGDGVVGGVGDEISYSFEVSNTGDVTLTDVSVTDPLVTVSGGPLTSLAPGDTDSSTFSATYVITQADVDVGQVVNSATVTGADPDGDPVTDTSDDPSDPTDIDPDGDGDPDDPTVTPLAQSPDVSVTKTSGALVDSNGDGVVGGVGDEISYSFVVTNTGDVTLTDVSVTDPLVTVSGGPLVSLAPGASDSTTFTAVYTITQVDIDAGEVVNSATVAGDDPAGDPVTDVSDDPVDPTDVDPDGDGDPDDPTVVPLAQVPGITVAKTAGPLVDSNGDGVVGGLGDEISYSFEVVNTGIVTLTDVTVTDALVTVSGGPLVALAPGVSDSTTFTATYTITQADVDAGEVVNSATVTGDDPAGDPVTDVSDDPGDPTDVDPDGDGDPDDPTVTPLVQNPDVSVTKTAAALVDSNGDGVVGGVGDEISYGFAVTNTGDVTLTDVTVTDPLVVVSGGPVASLAPGDTDSTTFTATYTITQADVDAGQVVNSATVTGDDPAGDPVTDVSDDPGDPTDVDPDGDGDPDDPTVTPLVQNPDVSVAKTAAALVDSNGDGVVGGVGDEISYGFAVTNTGDVTLTDVTVTDPLVVVSGGPVASLAPGDTDSTTFTATYTITQADVDAGQVVNSATVTGDDPAGDPVTDVSDDPGDPTDVDPDGDGDPDDPTVTPLVQNPDVSVTKSSTDAVDSNGDGVVGGVGDEISYGFVVSNTGDVTLTDVSVTDPLVTVAGGPVASLAPGASDSTTFTATYTITQADVDAGQVVNSATVTGDDPGGDPVTDISDDPDNPTDLDPDGDGDPDDPTVTPLAQSSEITLEKTAGSPSDTNGDGVVGGVDDQITYTFDVTNTGIVTLSNVTITDPLVAVSGGPLVSLAPGATDSTTFTAVYVITQADLDAGQVVNSATVTGSDPAGDPAVDVSDDPSDPTNIDPDGDGDPDDPTVVPLVQSPDVTVTKTAGALVDSNGDGVVGGVGDEISYSFAVTNTGDVTLSNVTVTDPLVAVAGGPVASLAPGDTDSTTFSAVYTISQADVDAGQVVNSATVTGDDPAGDPVTDVSDDPADPTDVDPDGDGDPDDPTVVPLVQSPDVSVTKTAGALVDSNGDGVVGGVGDEISYSFAVTNSGDVTLTDVSVTDPLVTVSGGPVASLAPGDTDDSTFTAVYTITQADVDAGQVVNSAVVSGSDPAGDPVTDTSDDPVDSTDVDPDGDGDPDDPTVVLLAQSPDVSVTKTAGPLVDTNGDGIAGSVGDQISYVFAVTNTGDVTLTDVSVTDPLVVVSGGPIVTLAPGDTDDTTFTAAYTITQADVDGGEVVNSATVTGSDPAGDPVTDVSDDPVDPTDIDPDGDGDPDDPTVTPLAQSPDVSVTKTAGAPADSNGDGVAGGVGDEISYSFVVTNTGDVTLTDVTVTDALVTVSGGPIASLAPGDTDSTTFIAVYTITQADVDAGQVVNSATVTGDDPAGDPVTDVSDDPDDPTDIDPDGDGDPDDPTVTPLIQNADLSVIKEAAALTDTNGDGIAGGVGDEVSYTFTVTNTGNVTLTNITVTDPLVAVSGGPIAALAPGDSDNTTFIAVYTITQADVDAGQVVNTATATGADPDGDPVTDNSDDPNNPTDADPDGDGDPDDPTVTPLAQTPELTLAKVGAPQTFAVVGETITYTYTVTNSGDVTLVAPFTINDDHIDTADIDCSTGPATLAPGQTFDCTADYTITQADVDAGQVTNEATVAAATTDGTPVSSPPVTETVSADLQADLSITKQVSDGSTNHTPGAPLTYTLTVANNGPSVTGATTVTDTLPTETTFVSATPTAGSCSQAAGTITCDLGSMAAGDTVTISVTIDVDPSSTGVLTNTATVVGDLPDPNPLDNDDTVATSPSPEADLVIDKTAPATYTPGEPVSYQLAVTNNGPSDAPDVVVTDQLPAGVTYDPTASDPTCAEVAGVVTCDPVTLAVGDTATFTIVVDTTSDLTTSLSNTATATSGVPDPDTTNNSDTETSDPDPAANLVVTKDGPTAPVAAGDQFDYTIIVTNDGPSDAVAVVVDDPLPAGITYVTSTVSGGAGTETCDATVFCDLGTIPAGGTETITVSVQVETDVTGDVLNTAVATTATPGDDPADSTDDHTTPVVEEADVAITKIDSIDPVVAGEQLSYTITAINNGPSQATGVTVSDPLPAGLTFVDAPGCTYDGAGRTVTCDIGTMAVGVPSTFTITTTVDGDVTGGTVLTNTATVSAASDPDPGNNTATETTDVVAEADLVITKVSSPNPFVPGQELTYTISVLNAGPSDAQNVTVNDTLPSGFFPTSIEPAAECLQSGAAIDCSFPSLAGGEAVTITVIGQTSPSATTFTNTATVDSDTPDPDPTNNTDDDVNDGDAVADLVVTKVDSVDPVVAGAELSYTITVTNNGPSDAVDVTVTDPVPAGLTVVTVDRAECDTSVSCTFPVITAGAGEQIVVTATVDPALTDNGDPSNPELTNTVTVDSATIDGDPTNNTATETTDVVEQADVVLTKIGQGGPITPGQQATFSIEVVNVGPSDADNVTVVDTLPAGMTFVSADSSTGTAVCAPDPGDPALVVCGLGTLAAGDPAVTITLTVDVAPDISGDVTNTAEATSSTPDPNPDNNRDDSEDPTTPDADLSIAKTDLVDPVVAGTQLTYQLTVRNGGPSQATGVVVTDNLPSDTSFVSATATAGSATCSADGSAVGGTITCDLGTMAPGAVTAVDVTVDVLAATADGTVMTNGAAVDSDTPDPNPDDNSATEDTTVIAVADVGVTKVASVNSATPGEAITWTIVVHNFGPSDATDVAINDNLPAGVTVTSITGATCTTGGPLTCDLGTLTPGQEIQIVIDAVIDPAAAGSLVNTVTVTTTTTDPNRDNDSADTEVPVVPEADLAIDKTGPATVVAGTGMTYTVIVTNNGPSDAADVVVTDTLPAGTSLVSATVTAGTGSCAGTTCTFGVVPAGTFAAITIEVDVSPDLASGTQLVNTASVDSATPDPDPTNNDDDQPTTVEQQADLSVIKTVSLNPFVPGQPLTYTVVVTNSGPSTALDTNVNDPVPDGLTITSATATDGTCSFDAVAVDCSLGDLPPGAQVTVTITADTDPAISETVANTVTVDSITDDPNPGDETSTVTTDPLPTADLEVTKTADLTAVVAGQQLTYRAAVTNLGPSTAAAVELNDALNLDVTYVTHTAVSGDGTCGWDVATRTVRCTIDALDPGETMEVEIVVLVAADVPDGSTIDNTAGATSPTPDPNPDNNTSTTVTDVTAVADVSIVKTLTTSTMVPGTPAQYQLVVTNDGPSDAGDVELIDSLPAGLTVTGITTTAGTCGHDGFSLDCDLGTVAPGAVVTITVDVLVAADVVDDVINTAVVDTSTTDDDPTNNTSTTVDTPTPQADLQALKRTLTDPVVPGQDVEYLITVVNGGPSDAELVTIVDDLPTGLTGLRAVPGQGTCAVAADVVTCDLGTVPAAASVNVLVTAAVDPTITGDLVNSITTDSVTDDPDPDNNTATVTDPTSPQADLSLVKTVEPEPFVPGEPITYTITVTNNGPSDAVDVSVTDVMPDGITAASATSGQAVCTVDDPLVTCELDDLGVGESFTITITADTAPNLVSESVNSAETSSATPDPDPDNNGDDAPATPDPVADLAIDKVGPAQVTAGTTVTYQLTVSNQGPSTAGNVEVVDNLPPELTFVSAQVDGGSCQSAAGTVTCLLAAIEPGQSVVITITTDISAAVDDATTIANTATVSSPATDPNLDDNTSTTETTVNPAPPELGVLSGTVWYDRDRDGTIDGDSGDEPGLEGVLVTVTGDADGDGVLETYQAITDSDGTYSFDLPPGEWTVTIDPTTAPPGLAPVTPTVENRTVVAGTETTVETGLSDGTLTGQIWIDADGDGVIDPGENNITGVRVTAVFAGPDGVIGTADDETYTQVTDGSYEFDHVPVGQPFTVTVDPATLPDELRPSYDPDGTLDNRSSGTVAGPLSPEVHDFGYQPPDPPPPPPTQPPPTIAFTGTETLQMLRLALILIGIGAALVVVGRQARQLNRSTQPKHPR